MNREPAKTFRDLIVWQKAHQFVLAAYRLSESFPKPEIYGLTSQLRRAAVSVPANIAEGFKKTGRADKARFMNIAQGWQRKPRPAELELLTERAKAALADLQFYYENVDRIRAALGSDAVREGAK